MSGELIIQSELMHVCASQVIHSTNWQLLQSQFFSFFPDLSMLFLA